tara:strand:+ start:501 stop:1277 length:777 start_codon:yes stop_codon:yes gene_type:complete
MKHKTLVCYVETDQHNKSEEKLLYSFNRVGINPIAFGKGETWGGWIHRLEMLREGLEKYVGKYDYVLQTDARDVLYYKDLNTIIERYEKHRLNGTRILFNAETNCYPNKELKSEYPYPDKKYRYLNAGCFIGDMNYVVKILDTAIERAKQEDVTDDQEMLSMMYIENYKLYGENTQFRLDTDCSIFQVLWDEDYGRSANFDVVYNRDRIYNKLTDTDPCIFHAPGPTCTLSQVWKIINKKWNYLYPQKKYLTRIGKML